MNRNSILVLIVIAAAVGSMSAAHAQQSFKVAPNRLTRKESLAIVQSLQDPFWLRAKAAVTDDVMPLMSAHGNILEREIPDHTISSGSPGRKLIALTFDDGPHAAYTPELLAILRQYDAKATFFVVGQQAEMFPDLIKDEVAAGDTVGNHTFDHISLPKLSPEYAAVEIKACGEVLLRITGKAPHFFRPPGGEYSAQDAEEAEALGYRLVLWTDDPGDYASPGADVIFARTVAKIRPGGIILLHDGIGQTVEVLPRILEYLRDNGYQTVTLDELMREDPPANASDWNIAKADGLVMRE